MTKKIKDMTKDDMDAICDGNECPPCPLKSICVNNAYLAIEAYGKGVFDKEVEIPEATKK